MSSKYDLFSADIIPLFASERATTSPHAGDSINSTRPTQAVYETDDRVFPECAATSPSAVLLTTHKKRYQRWGVPDELLVKEAFYMFAFQQKVCSKCGQYPAAGNQLRRCGSCLAVKYCSSACQNEDLASHKLVSKNVGAARKEKLMPLLLAAGNGDVATVERLLKAGAKVDGGAFYGNQESAIISTPLLTAARTGRAAVVAVLLKAGAKMNRATAGGFTPLFVAAQEGHTAVVLVLMEQALRLTL